MNDTDKKIIEIIAEITNHDPQEIEPSSHFLDDLSIDVEEEEDETFLRIVTRINKEFGIRLDPELFYALSEENRSVAQFLSLVRDEVEL